MSNATKYNIELRDKNGNLKTYLTPFASNPSWEWNRIGECGRAKIRLNMPYRKIEFEADDDIQIRIKSGSTSKLVYRGYISLPIPTLRVPETIDLNVRGYFDKLMRIVVQDNNAKKTYTGKIVLNIVEDLVNTFVTPNTIITKGSITAGAYNPDVLDFKEFVRESFRTLADLEGKVEYGVDENLNFFFIPEGDDLTHNFRVGNNVSNFERRIDWNKLVNKIYFEGGDVNGIKFTDEAIADDSITMFFLSERIVTNSSIITKSVADQYLGSLLRISSQAPVTMRATIKNTDVRLEDNLPIGKIAVVDPEYDQYLHTWGTLANGGSDLVYGLKANGGSDAVWGGTFKGQIDRIKYTMSDTDERFNIEISTGSTVSETSAALKQLELGLSNLQQA